MRPEAADTSGLRPHPDGVHNHGPDRGPGTACPEYRIGQCRQDPTDPSGLREAWLDVKRNYVLETDLQLVMRPEHPDYAACFAAEHVSPPDPEDKP